MRFLSSFLLSILTLGSIFLGLQKSYRDPDECLLSYRYEPPVYMPIMTKGAYTLYLFRENDRLNQLGGTPVLFIPGNAGSYKQGLALSSLCSKYPEFDWFLLDFNEDLSVIHGQTMINEAVFANEAIKFILDYYKLKADTPERGWTSADPTSVVLVGHSMGGIVARTMVTLDNYLNNSVNMIYTLSTPHAQPPLTFDLDVTQLYDVVGQWWRSSKANSIELISIAGGHMDTLIPPGLALADSFGGISVQSYEIPTVNIGINHLAIVWCVQLRRVVIESLNSIADHALEKRTIDNKRNVLKSYFKQTKPNIEPNLFVGPKILYGFSARLRITENSNIELPAISSLVSYKVKASKEVGMSQFNTIEFRDYGETKEQILMWSSASPYIPFEKPQPPKLVLGISGVNGERVDLKISVDWSTTLANMVMYYRTMLASYPFAVMLLAVFLSSMDSNRNGFLKYILNGVAGTWFWPISALLTTLHFLSIFAPVRNLLRIFEIHSESAVVAGLQFRNFDDNDILLGVMDPHLFWVPTVVFALACWAAIAFSLAIHALLLLKSYIFKGDFLVKGDDGWAKFALKWSVFAVVIYLVPFQATTVFFFAFILIRLQNFKDNRMGLVHLMMCAALVDAPILVVYLRSIELKWLLSFKGLTNALLAWPFGSIALLPFKRFEMGRILKAMLLYVFLYTLLYGGLHSFQVHYFTHFLLSVLLIQNP